MAVTKIVEEFGMLKSVDVDHTLKIHDSGRRELRRDIADRPLKTYYAPDPKNPEKYRPVMRAERKRPEGVSARQWKRQRMADLRAAKNDPAV